MPEEPPFPGPRPFSSEESSRFFGRANEVAELASLVRSHAAVLLHADSGAGKSSLIEAGLRPRLEKRLGAVVLSGRVKGPLTSGGVGTGNVYVENVLRSLGPGTESSGSSAASATRLVEGLRGVDWGDSQLRVVVIDQLEEVFTLYPGRWSERRDFFDQIQEAIGADRLLRFVLAMRADYLTRLYPYTSAFSDDLRTRYGLERLRRQGAVDAIVRPTAESSRRFSPAAADALVGELLAIPNEVRGGPPVAGEFVEPGELQIVCRDIWQRVPPGEISPDQIPLFARLEEVHGRFYDRAVGETVAATGFDERRLRRWFGDSLITPAGTRGFQFRDNTHTGGLPNAVVDVLEQQQLVRAEQRANSQWYELTHDRMVAAVVESNREWFARRARTLRLRLAVLVSVLVAAVLVVAVVQAVRGPGTENVADPGPEPATLPTLATLDEQGFLQPDGPPERVPFTARAGTDAMLSVGPDDPEHSAKPPWTLKLLLGDRELVPTATESRGGAAYTVFALPVDGTYEVEISGGDGFGYALAGDEALRVPLVDGAFEGSVVGQARANVHPVHLADLSVVTVASEGFPTLRVLSAAGRFLGGPDFEEDTRSRTVLASGDYLLEAEVEEGASYALRVETPEVDKLAGAETREASIDVKDELDVYRFDPPVGQVAIFRMRSADLWPSLTVFTPDGLSVEVLYVDDAPGVTSALVAFLVTKEGPHYIVATAESDGERSPTGAYQVSYIIGELPP